MPASLNHATVMMHDFKRRFFIALFLTIPIIWLSLGIQPPVTLVKKSASQAFLLFVFSTILYGYCGFPFFKGCIKEIRRLTIGMMTLIAMALSIAYSYSTAVLFGLEGKLFFWELATLIDVMLIGHYLEMKATMSASSSIKKLIEYLPSVAHLVTQNHQTRDVETKTLQTGDLVVIKPGEKIPIDGIVVDGFSTINQAALTGESTSVKKVSGNSVLGGSINNTGSLTIKVTKPAEQSYFSHVIELVKKTMASKSSAQLFADKAAQWLTIIAIASGIITLLVWINLAFPFSFALERAVTVMIITCPHALGLAIPLVVATITSLATYNGFIIRNRSSFEQCRNITTVVFDKTGTLTQGTLGITDIITLGSWDRTTLLAKAAALEQKSEHPIARNIVEKAFNQKLNIPSVKQFQALPGKGIRGTIDNESITIGNKKIITELTPDAKATHQVLIAECITRLNKLEQEGKTAIIVISNDVIQGIIALNDIIRSPSKQACVQLKKAGINVVMITGDNADVASYVAKHLGIETFFANVLVDEKPNKIKDLQQKSEYVAMVGDGINDAPALMQADVGIAVGSGTDIAIDAADIVLSVNNPLNIIDIINLSQLSHKKMMQNLLWETGYNVVAIPLAAGVLHPFGIHISPAVGAAIMSLSTIAVALNARYTYFTKTSVSPPVP